MKQIKVVQRNVNSSKLFKDIDEVMQEALTSFGVQWRSEEQRNEFIEIMEEYFDQLVEQGKLAQHKCICDYRNNKTFSGKELILEVHYKQPHCLNTTTLEYHIPNR